MRRSWPDASEALGFEGQVLTRGTALVDFRLPVPEGVFQAGEDSVVFVAPAISSLPDEPARASRPSFPGAHWLTPPPELSEEMRARSSRPDPREIDDDEPTLPVIPLSRRRGTGDALASAGEELVGRTPAARVARVGVVVSLIFAGLAAHALGNAHPAVTASAVATPDANAHTPVAALVTRTSKTGTDSAHVAAAPAPVVISGAPVWIVLSPSRGVTSTTKRPGEPLAPLVPGVPETLGLPRPAPPPPRSEFARL